MDKPYTTSRNPAEETGVSPATISGTSTHQNTARTKHAGTKEKVTPTRTMTHSLKAARELLRDGDTQGSRRILCELIARKSYPSLLREAASMLLDELGQPTRNDDNNTTAPQKKAQEIRQYKFRPYRCTVIAWDGNHNCVGRAYVLAKAASLIYKHVDLLGFDFNHLGKDVWSPLRSSDIPVNLLTRPKTTSELIKDCNLIAGNIETDLVIVSKARLPSTLLGCILKKRYGIPLIIDIDDYEPGFVTSEDMELFNRGHHCLPIIKQAANRLEEPPFSPFWTHYTNHLIPYADEVITSNTSLQKLYGGSILPHLRDHTNTTNDTTCEDLSFLKARKHAKFIIMFLGTPRRHKGAIELAQTTRDLRSFNVETVFVGSFSDMRLKSEMQEICREGLTFIDDIPFDKIASYLSLADAIVLLQDPNSLASIHQLPAKAIDALRCGKKIIGTDTEPLRMIRDMGFCGISLIEDASGLRDSVLSSMNTPFTSDEIQLNRDLFNKNLSYQAGVKVLREVIDSATRGHALTREKTIIDESKPFLDLLLHGEPSSPKRLIPRSHSNQSHIIVLLWKQNDFMVFGRRADMVAQYLASRADVLKVIAIERPLSTRDYAKYLASNESHYKLLSRYLSKKRMGLLNTEKIEVASPIMPEGLSHDEQMDFVVKYVNNKLNSVASGFIMQHPELRTELWVYPCYPYADDIIKQIKPDITILDIVDDHRKWPNLSSERVEYFDRHYSSLLRLCDASIYNCAETMDSIGANAKSPKYLIPNGLDISLVKIDSLNHRDIKQELLDQHKCDSIIGYAGNLESKIDWDIISLISARFPDSLILLVGSTHVSTQRPEGHNIHYTGAIPYNELLTLIKCFDVAIVPHVSTSLTKAMNPLKVYVYIAAGLPIVSTNIPNLPDPTLTPNLHIAKDHESFCGLVRKVLDGSIVQDPDLAISFMSENSWGARLEGFVDRIHSEVIFNSTL